MIVRSSVLSMSLWHSDNYTAYNYTAYNYTAYNYTAAPKTWWLRVVIPPLNYQTV
jgi:hypothetical protein